MSKVGVISEGHIDNTKVWIDGEEQKNIESLRYEIDRNTRVGILTVTFYYLDDNQYVVSGDTKAFNDEEDDIAFRLDGDIPGTPIVEQPKTFLDVMKERK